VKILKSALRMGFLLAKNNPLPEKKYICKEGTITLHHNTNEMFYLH
jgi:hypothetical protein